MNLTHRGESRPNKPYPGEILQVQSVSHTAASSEIAITTWTNIGTLSIDIKPRQLKSKFLLRGVISGSGNDSVSLRFARNGVGIGVGNAAGSRIQITGSGLNSNVAFEAMSSSIEFMDSPSAFGSINYRIQYYLHGAVTFFLNSSSTDGNTASYARSISTLTVMEIAV